MIDTNEAMNIGNNLGTAVVMNVTQARLPAAVIQPSRAGGLKFMPTVNTITGQQARRIDGRIKGIVPGKPIGKPRQSQSDKWKKRPCVMRYRAWADLVRQLFPDVPEAECVSELRITAYFEMPASWSKRTKYRMRGAKHRARSDCDNVLKSVMDALWKNDSAIADAVIRKRWDWQARTEIEIVLNPA